MSPTAIRSLIETDVPGDDAAGTVSGAVTAGAAGSEARAGAAGAAGADFVGTGSAAVAPGQLPGSACGDSNCRGGTRGALTVTRWLSTRGGCLVAIAGTSSSAAV